MKTYEHLLTIVSEECAEVAHRVSKCLRFSKFDIQPGQDKDNGERAMEEFYDLVAVIEKCQRMNILPEWGEDRIKFHKEAKNIRVEQFLKHSKEVGTLID